MLNTDYGYCNGVDCPLRDNCKRYSTEALNADIPLWWTDGFYDEQTGKCDFMDEKQSDNEA